MSLGFTILFWLLSSVLGFAAGYVCLLAVRQQFDWRYLTFGAGMFFVGIALHSLIALPVVFYEKGLKLLFVRPENPVTNFKFWELIYFAFAAGIGQETAKAFPIFLEQRAGRNIKSTEFFSLGLNIGIGFSLGEILFLAVNGWQVGASAGNLVDIAVGGFERFSATIFHVATAGLIAFGFQKNKVISLLLLSILLHSLLDGIVSLINKFSSPPVIFLESGIFLVSVAVFTFVAIYFKRNNHRLSTNSPVDN